MSYTIYQMPLSLWHSRYAWFDKNSEVRRIDYCPVYQGDLAEESQQFENNEEALGYLFEKFNLEHPRDYASRSMSAGDVIMIGSGDNAKYYLCCSFDWHELDNF